MIAMAEATAHSGLIIEVAVTRAAARRPGSMRALTKDVSLPESMREIGVDTPTPNRVSCRPHMG
jgi:hypothetical protein